MPLTLRPKDALLDSILSSLLAGNIVTDISQISVVRQLSEGVASTQADLGYDLYSLLQLFYLSSAEGQDLDARGSDMGLVRDPGQAASDPVVFTKLPLHIDDIPLPAPQVVQATLADGTTILYRSIGDTVLRPSGRSVSGAGPGTTLTSGVNDQLALNLDSDGVRTVALGTQSTAIGIAAAIQAAVQALTAIGPSHQTAYDDFRCDYGVTTPGAYTLRSGTAGPTSTVVVTAAGGQTASVTLKLGVAAGGTEAAGAGTLSVPVLCDTLGVLGNVGAGQINTQVSPVAGIAAVHNPLAFANGREPASDDAYRQDVRSRLRAARGSRDAIESAVYAALGEDGQRHVQSAQVLSGAGSVQVYICDGRSLTVGAQSNVVENVQDELEGRGQTIGGWIADGNVVGVAPASVLTVDVDVDVLVGATPDLSRAQLAITNALYQLLYTAGVGQLLSVMRLDGTIDATVVEVFNITWRLPLAFTTTPPGTVGGGLGVKPMPGRIVVRVARA